MDGSFVWGGGVVCLLCWVVALGGELLRCGAKIQFSWICDLPCLGLEREISRSCLSSSCTQDMGAVEGAAEEETGAAAGDTEEVGARLARLVLSRAWPPSWLTPVRPVLPNPGGYGDRGGGELRTRPSRSVVPFLALGCSPRLPCHLLLLCVAGGGWGGRDDYGGGRGGGGYGAFSLVLWSYEPEWQELERNWGWLCFPRDEREGASLSSFSRIASAASPVTIAPCKRSPAHDSPPDLDRRRWRLRWRRRRVRGRWWLR